MTSTTDNTCPDCNGTGNHETPTGNTGFLVATHEVHTCETCHGYGKTEIVVSFTPDEARLMQEAMYCWAHVLRDSADECADSTEFADSSIALRDKAGRCVALAPRFI